MPQFFFDLYDGPQVVVDSHGKHLRDEVAARKEAAKILGEVTRDALGSDTPQHEFRLVVRLQKGDPLWVTHLRWETRGFQRS